MNRELSLKRGLEVLNNKEIKTPAYVIDEKALLNNLQLLKKIEDDSGAKILLAQKCYSCFATYPLISKYLSGTTSSGLYESRLAKECFEGENHVFSVAYSDDELEKLIKYADHFSINTIYQLKRYYKILRENNKSIGLRINPMYSTQDNSIYNPCSEFSRMGVNIYEFIEAFDNNLIPNIDGIHFHTLCEQLFEPLLATFKRVEELLGDRLNSFKWINLGGGHHLTSSEYNRPALIELIKYIKDKYSLEVYLEPGEAVAYYSGYLISEVLDIIDNKEKIAVLDSSASCHLSDVIEHPFDIDIIDEYIKREYKYILSSKTCLTGDIFGTIDFSRELKIGDRVGFMNMAIYSFVKNNTFNGMPLPSIYLYDIEKNVKLIKEFSYNDFKSRLS